MITMEKAIKIYKSYGGHFFDEDTMGYWNSKIVSPLFSNRCFVTGEDNYNKTEYLFSIRQFSEDFSTVYTIDFQEWDNLERARNYAEQL